MKSNKTGRITAKEKETRKIQKMTTYGLLRASSTHPKDPHHVS